VSIFLNMLLWLYHQLTERGTTRNWDVMGQFATC